MPSPRQNNESGFILMTALAVLGLLSVMGLGLYTRNLQNQQASLADLRATQAYYFAETALNFVFWAMENDCELDGYNPADPTYAAISNSQYGDWTELTQNIFEPGPTSRDSSDLEFDGGQVRYFDNRPTNDPTTTTINYVPGAPPEINFSTLNLPRHLNVAIDKTSGTVSLHTTPISESVTPANGAAVWLRAFDRDAGNAITDGADISLSWDVGAGMYSVDPTAYVAVGDTLGVAIYAIAFVDGQPKRMVRAVYKKLLVK
jgi:hypothetical protein